MGTLLQDRQAVENLLDGLAVRMSPGAMLTAFYALKDFAGYAQAQGWCVAPALLDSDRPGRNPDKPIVVYTEDEVDRIVDGARGVSLRWYCLLATLADTGRRVGETLALRWEWLRLDSDPPHWHMPTSKNGKQQYVPLGSRLVNDVYTEGNIKELMAEERVGAQRQFSRSVDEYPFPWTYTCVHRMFRRHCARIGVEPRGFHNLRHTKATELLARGVPLQAVSALLGHASVATTDRVYNHANALSYARYL